MVIHLEAMKRRMEQARLWSRMQNALLELARERKLGGRFYWSGLPGMVEHPNRHYLPSLCGARTITIQGVEGPSRTDYNGVKQRRTEPSTEQRAVQRVYNTCRLCKRTRHWMRECEEPHNGYAGPYCKLRRDHPGFYKQRCKYPCRQVGQQGGTKRQWGKEAELMEEQGVGETIDIDMLVDNSKCLYISD